MTILTKMSKLLMLKLNPLLSKTLKWRFLKKTSAAVTKLSCQKATPENVIILFREFFSQLLAKYTGKPAKEYPFKLDPFQQTAVNCLEMGESVLVVENIRIFPLK